MQCRLQQLRPRRVRSAGVYDRHRSWHISLGAAHYLRLCINTLHARLHPHCYLSPWQFAEKFSLARPGLDAFEQNDAEDGPDDEIVPHKADNLPSSESAMAAAKLSRPWTRFAWWRRN